MANNVGFKRGLHSALPLTGATEGVFYLTTDTERFYVGKSDGTLAELNKSIRSVANTDALPDITSSKVAIGDFYYITSGNILAVCVSDSNVASGKKWVQINPDTDTDTKVSSATFSVATANDIATITQTIKLADKNGKDLKQDKTSTFKIKGGNGVNVTSSGSEITLTGDYSFSVDPGANAADVNLLASGTEQDDFTIAGGQNVTVTTDTANKKVIIAAKDTNTIVSGGSLEFDAETGTVSLTLQDEKGKNLVDLSSTDKIFYKVGNDPTEYVPSSTLPVYTKDQIDDKLKGLNGLTYKGTVGSGGSAGDNLPATKVSIGDMYLVTGTATVTGSGNAGKKGDLFIATGTEGADGFITGNVTWTYVPSGDDKEIDTTYKAVADTTAHSLTLKDSNNSDQGGIDLDAGTAIELKSSKSTSGNGEILKTEIKHADVARTDPDPIVPNSTKPTEIVIGVTTNEQGHVTAVQTATVDGSTLRGYKLEGTNTVTASSVTTKHKLSTKDGAEKGTITNVVSSSSLKFAKATNGNGYSIDLEWGDF